MRLIVGLGNPGSEYVGTRHNVGFEAIDRIAARIGLTFAPGEFDRLARSKFNGLALDGSMRTKVGGSEKLLLLKPLTYMNLSGKAVLAAMAFYQLSPDQIIIVLDDLALPCGKIRLRAGGSSGGHNGLKDIERVLGSNNYPRLRIGIDAAPARIPGRDYVLGRFTDSQRVLLEPALDLAAGAVLTWAEFGIAAAMNQYNGENAEA